VSPQVISVSEFIGIINETLGFAYPQVVVEGEVSGFKVSQGKFVFFDLKDEANVLGCFMMTHQLKLPLEDGMKIRVTGGPKVTKFSRFSLTVRSVEMAGEGELRRAMELLKAKLTAEGLFDPARKRPLPLFPRRIGLITSATSAAYADFIKILNARWSGVEVLLADVNVQGAAAPDQIVAALAIFNELSSPVDVVVLIRGGGSLEDLAAFSTEPVARAVAASRTPTIVGVGHEVDTSLADYASDLRAATPTDAARLVVPDRRELAARVDHDSHRLASRLNQLVLSQRRRIDDQLNLLERSLRRPREHISRLADSLWRNFERLQSRQLQAEVGLSALAQRLRTAETNRRLGRQQQLASLERVLRGFDPQGNLNRGYAIVRAGDKIVRDPAAVQPGDELMIQLAKGRLSAAARKNR
jgi:exodeoxyribonuclease VII large subunit